MKQVVAILRKPVAEALELMETVASNNEEFYGERDVSKRGFHHSYECPQVEQAQFVANTGRQQNNPYSNTYNPGMRNHPNFSWRDQGASSSTFMGQLGLQQQPCNNNYHNLKHHHLIRA
ncbi:hypothetical protein CCACVL1_30394 [Corchorus capsularis]|uniref:Uncharacterized protein n=1 Tax=Corchorus capsularis TaxID=210143 RepID=A0A1R3FXD7_COCAP|nr:hypothetical protein CCACVL1_30394 [Corchorus capsularis]